MQYRAPFFLGPIDIDIDTVTTRPSRSRDTSRRRDVNALECSPNQPAGFFPRLFHLNTCLFVALLGPFLLTRCPSPVRVQWQTGKMVGF